VQARVEGYVTRLFVKAPLVSVKRGEPLVEILSPDWLAAQEEYLAVLEATSERGRAIRDAARQRLIVLGVPEATVRALERDRRTRASTTLAAPMEGVLAEIGVREGSTFMAGAPLFRINGLQRVWVHAQVPEAQVASVPPGATVQASASAFPGESFEGVVEALLPEVDPRTRTLTARIAVENPEARLVPGMFVRLSFTAQAAPQLAVPSEALIITGERSVVIATRADGGFEVVPVVAGHEAGGWTPILEGLEEGRAIVLSGQFLIDSEASLRSAVHRLDAGTPAGELTAADSAAAPTEGALPVYSTRGTVRAIRAGEIVIEHEPIPALDWPVMTMPFQAPPGVLPEPLHTGDRVSFTFVEVQGGFRIERLTVDGGGQRHEDHAGHEGHGGRP
jgi:membrane fusion protein, copper/silver efflux system